MRFLEFLWRWIIVKCLWRGIMMFLAFLCWPLQRFKWSRYWGWIIVKCLWCGDIGRNDSDCCSLKHE